MKTIDTHHEFTKSMMLLKLWNLQASQANCGLCLNTSNMFYYDCMDSYELSHCWVINAIKLYAGTSLNNLYVVKLLEYRYNCLTMRPEYACRIRVQIKMFYFALELSQLQSSTRLFNAIKLYASQHCHIKKVYNALLTVESEYNRQPTFMKTWSARKVITNLITLIDIIVFDNGK